MRPLDPRLLRHARQVAAPIAALAGTGLASALATIAQAWLLALMIAEVFIDKATLNAELVPLSLLAGVTVVRAGLAWAAQAVAHRASETAKAGLRGALLTRLIEAGPVWRRQPATGGPLSGGARDAAALTQLATVGLDDLDGYFTSYLPALVLAAAVPLAVLITIAVADPLSGLIVALTLPLMPLFGALIGMATSQQARQRWRTMATLAHHFHDVVGGLHTLKVFGREGVQRGQIERVTREYRRATMATLRLAFASSLALELVATMSVALVATEIGLRLAYGHLDLRTGLLVLILAPEAYLPLRALGSQFHATAGALAAAEEVFAILETPAPDGPVPVEPVPVEPVPVEPVPAGRPGAIRVAGVSVRHEGRADPAPDNVTLTIRPGRLTVIAGPSGSGKTTLLNCLLGFTQPTAGSITPRPVLPKPEARAAERAGLAVSWLPQEPTLFAGTVADNIRLGWPDAPEQLVAAAARDAALDEVGLDRRVGERGAGLSAGQRRRVALARALLPAPPLLLLDEPTAGLDADREAVVVATLRRYAAAGHAVVTVSHRPAVIEAADEIVNCAVCAVSALSAGSPEGVGQLSAQVPA
jgi:thiol reductant ABC exporter CydD subunit